MAPCVDMFNMITILVPKFNRLNVTPMKLKVHSFSFFRQGQTRLWRATFVLLMFSAESNYLFGQAQLVFGPTATYVRMSGGTSGTPFYMVVGNSANTGIVPNTGGIIAEGEFNYVKWNIGSATGVNYTIPLRDETAPATENTSVKFDITSGGSAGGFFLVSTWDGATWDNLTYKPTPVTNMTSNAIANASAYVIDRFWSLIDEASYPVKPALANLIFTYVDNEWSAAGNSVAEGSLGAQRWKSTDWDGVAFPPQGTINTAANTVSLAAVASADVFRWWTLVDKIAPLPVQWLSLSAECIRGDVIINWSTATEQNSDYFTVERSLDGTNFSAIATKSAANNSNTVQNYSAVDNDAYSGTSFYRVKETDFNESFIYSGAITVSGCSGDDVIIYGEDGGAVVNINASADGQYNIEMYNALGQKIIGQIANVAVGNNHIRINPDNISSAIYVVKVCNSGNAVVKKVFVRSNY